MLLNWKKNIGNTDRVIRALIGSTLLVLVFTGKTIGWWTVAAMAVGIFQLAEAWTAY